MLHGLLSGAFMKKPKFSQEQLLALYKEMLFYRRFEEKVIAAYMKQKFSGFCHLHIGQEALCVGVQHCLEPTDYVISGYRSHTQAIAKGIAPGAVFAELFGKESGCSKGKGGSMHMFSKEHRFLGGHGIVGAQAPLATGVAFTIKYHKKPEVIVCYLGDAAMNQGAVFEAMNMAATWDLPVLYIIENNQYGMGTRITRTTSIDKLSKRALAFDMDHSEVNGMDVIDVINHVKPIVASMKKKPKSYLLEAHTYRYKGHSVSDPGTYRSKEEVAEYQEIDPITTLGNFLKKQYSFTDEQLKTLSNEAKELSKAAEAFADQSKEPELSTLWDHVYAE